MTKDGKLNVLGRFTTINAPTFPVRHPSMVLVVEFQADAFESGEEKHIVVVLRDQDFSELARAEAKMTLPKAEGGREVDLIAPITFRDVVFKQPGPHEFVISVNGDVKATTPVSVTASEEAESG